MESGKLQECLLENMITNQFCLSEAQIGKEDHAHWVFTTNALFSLGVALNNGEQSEKEVRDQIYAGIRVSMELIGDVNGYPLRRHPRMDDTVSLLASYAIESETRDDKYRRSAKQWFQHYFEGYLMNLIVDQTAKSQEVLEAEKLSIEAARKAKRKNNKNEKRKKELQLLENFGEETVETTTIQYTDYVVVCRNMHCIQGHEVSQKNVKLRIIAPEGTVNEMEATCGYCSECNSYFLFEKDYRHLQTQGVLLCQIVSENQYLSAGTQVFGGLDLLPESKLHQCGYSVSASSNLTEKQRQRILASVIENDLYTKFALINFLDWLIERNEKIKHKDMSSALGKWKADRNFVANYVYEK